MSNKILLELTEDEALLLEAHLKAEKLLVLPKSTETTERRLLDSTINKIESALKSQHPMIIGIKDLHYIISRAKGEYQNLPKDLYISRNRVEEDDFKHIALVNSVIMWLNGNSLLKKLAQFDYTDHSCEFEASDE